MIRAVHGTLLLTVFAAGCNGPGMAAAQAAKRVATKRVANKGVPLMALPDYNGPPSIEGKLATRLYDWQSIWATLERDWRLGGRSPADEDAARIRVCGTGEGDQCAGDPPWVITYGGDSEWGYYMLAPGPVGGWIMTEMLAELSSGQCPSTDRLELVPDGELARLELTLLDGVTVDGAAVPDDGDDGEDGDETDGATQQLAVTGDDGGACDHVVRTCSIVVVPQTLEVGDVVGHCFVSG